MFFLGMVALTGLDQYVGTDFYPVRSLDILDRATKFLGQFLPWKSVLYQSTRIHLFFVWTSFLLSVVSFVAFFGYVGGRFLKLTKFFYPISSVFYLVVFSKEGKSKSKTNIRFTPERGYWRASAFKRNVDRKGWKYFGMNLTVCWSCWRRSFIRVKFWQKIKKKSFKNKIHNDLIPLLVW